MTIMFQYNQEQALQAGESGFINQTGAYVGKITSAKWVKAKSSYAAALELSFEDINGLKANYISLWHTKSDGQPNPFAQQHIQAIMGLTGVQQLTAIRGSGEEIHCPELLNKPIGFILQKILFTKQDGSDGFKFEIVVSSHAQTGQTMKEKIEGKAAERVRKLMETLKDKDERNHQAAPTPYPTAPLTPPQRQAQAKQPVQPVNDVEDDVPF